MANKIVRTMANYSYKNFNAMMWELEDTLIDTHQQMSIPMETLVREVNKAYLAMTKRKTVTDGDREAINMTMDMINAIKNHIDKIQ